MNHIPNTFDIPRADNRPFALSSPDRVTTEPAAKRKIKRVWNIKSATTLWRELYFIKDNALPYTGKVAGYHGYSVGEVRQALLEGIAYEGWDITKEPFGFPPSDELPLGDSQNVLPEDDAARLDFPLFDGLVAYFPSALAEVARVSKIGNDQHNPGEPLGWARGKSTDHGNKIMRHLLDVGRKDKDGVRHAARLAWRALALLQTELEQQEGAPLAPASR